MPKKYNLILNCGSSSVKYRVFISNTETCIAKGIVEKIGTREAGIKHKTEKQKIHKVAEVLSHKKAIQMILNFLLHKEKGAIKNISDIKAVGHRFVHGGKYSEAVIATKEVKAYLKDVTFELAPLHNPYNFQGVEAIEDILPGVPNICVFDTSFHQTIPDYAYIYGLPYRYFQKYKIRRYGFHGTSHNYVYLEALKLLKKKKANVITCHLGNGASISAIKDGKCIDTTMGYTPLEGLIMGTRSGDVDPAAVLHIMMEEELRVHEMETILNRQSGLLGISGISNDLREILKEKNKGNPRAILAFKAFCFRVKKYIGAYLGELNGCDAIVFTAGIGENAPQVREEALKNMENLGIVLNSKKNAQAVGEKGIISADTSKIKVFVIPTNEELMISRIIDQLIKE